MQSTHPSYTDSSTDHDVALLTLARVPKNLVCPWVHSRSGWTTGVFGLIRVSMCFCRRHACVRIRIGYVRRRSKSVPSSGPRAPFTRAWCTIKCSTSRLRPRAFARAWTMPVRATETAADLCSWPSTGPSCKSGSCRGCRLSIAGTRLDSTLYLHAPFHSFKAYAGGRASHTFLDASEGARASFLDERVSEQQVFRLAKVCGCATR